MEKVCAVNKTKQSKNLILGMLTIVFMPMSAHARARVCVCVCVCVCVSLCPSVFLSRRGSFHSFVLSFASFK